jgi:hypothetical protein
MTIDMEVVETNGRMEVIDREGHRIPFESIRSVVLELRQEGHKTYARLPDSIDLQAFLVDGKDVSR